MSVEMNKRISMKPGFGKKLETPRFNKQSLSSTRGADSSVFSHTTSLNRTSLKESGSKTISTSTLNKSISTSYTNSSSSVFNSKSSNYVPGNHFLGVSDYYRDRNEVRTGITTGIGYDASVGGYRSGKHDLELYTGGLTQRSERRMMQRAGMVDLSKLGQIDNGSSGSGGKKMSWVAKLGLGLLGAGVAVGAGVPVGAGVAVGSGVGVSVGSGAVVGSGLGAAVISGSGAAVGTGSAGTSVTSGSGSLTSLPFPETPSSATTLSASSAAFTPVGIASTIADNIVMQKNLFRYLFFIFIKMLPSFLEHPFTSPIIKVCLKPFDNLKFNSIYFSIRKS